MAKEEGRNNAALPEGTLVRGRWRLAHVLGKGAFGITYLAVDEHRNRTVALKMEHADAKKSLLRLEVVVLKRLLASGAQHACRYYGSGTFTPPSLRDRQSNIQDAHQEQRNDASDKGSGVKDQNDLPIGSPFVVMQLLGCNLGDLRRRQPNTSFSIETTALLGRQMLRAIRDLHTVGFLHRDVKPSNFALALPNEATDNYGHSLCYLFDFGLCRRYVSMDGEIRPQRRKIGFRGTARYASLRTHDGHDSARVDDLFSLFYSLAEFILGVLPWRKEKDKERIAEMKRTYDLSCLPDPLQAFYNYLTLLSYKCAPDYDFLDSCLQNLFRLSNQPESIPYDWDVTSETMTTSTNVARRIQADNQQPLVSLKINLDSRNDHVQNHVSKSSHDDQPEGSVTSKKSLEEAQNILASTHLVSTSTVTSLVPKPPPMPKPNVIGRVPRVKRPCE